MLMVLAVLEVLMVPFTVLVHILRRHKCYPATKKAGRKEVQSHCYGDDTLPSLICVKGQLLFLKGCSAH